MVLVLVSHGFCVHGINVMEPLKGWGELYCNGPTYVSGKGSLGQLGRVFPKGSNGILLARFFPRVGVLQG